MKRLTFFFAGALLLAGCLNNPIAPLPRSGAAQAPTLAPNASAQSIATATAIAIEESAPLPTEPKAPTINNQTWLNTDRALSQADLTGKVVLIDFWTFG